MFEGGVRTWLETFFPEICSVPQRPCGWKGRGTSKLGSGDLGRNQRRPWDVLETQMPTQEIDMEQEVGSQGSPCSEVWLLERENVP